MESHSIMERAFILHLKDEKEMERQERERQEESGEGKEGDRQRQGEKGFSLRGLVSQLPHLPHNLGKAPALSNLILHISEVGLIARSPGTELRKVRIRDVLHRKHAHRAPTRAQEAEPPEPPPPPPAPPAPWILHGICWKTDPGKAASGTEEDCSDLDPLGH